MSNFIYIDVGAKIQTVGSCVKLTPNQTYEDTVTKELDYTGQVQVNISITNYCATTFVVPAFILFTDNTNGGNFEARISEFTILGGQTITIPVHYHGVNKSTTTPKNFNISLHGISAVYKLNIFTPQVNTPPVISDIIVPLENRQSKIFSVSDFTSHYYDADGDDLSAVILVGDVSAFRLNGNSIVSGQEIPVNLINAGLFQFVSQNTDSEIEVVVTLKAKDEAGSVSV